MRKVKMPDVCARIATPLSSWCVGCRVQMIRKGDRVGVGYGVLHKCPECGRIVRVGVEE